MPLVTVCIPSYRSAAFIRQTLSAVREQTLTDYRVVLAIEPPDADATIAAARPFLTDERFSYYVNETTLGYAGNVRSVLRRVATPYFVVLPHDDAWHPRYLEALAGRLMPRPDASAAFADAFVFGYTTAIRAIDFPDAQMSERLLAWALAAGAQGLPWRGLARREVLDSEFPVNDFEGFAVEVEWTLHLLGRGVVLRHPEPLYLKRLPPRDSPDSASVAWTARMPIDRLRLALEHHRVTLHARLADLMREDANRQAAALALEATVAYRFVQFSNGRFDFSPADEQRIADARRASAALEPATRDPILARFGCALGTYHLQRRDFAAAEAEAVAAVARDPDYAPAVLLLSRILPATGRPLEALPLVYRASRLDPDGKGLAAVQESLAKRIGRLFAPPGASEG